jgi:AraC-like DNA-binding protein
MSFLARHLILDTASPREARDEQIMFRGISDYRPLDAPGGFRLRVASVLCGDVRVSAVATTGHAISLVEEDTITILAPYCGRIATEAGSSRFEAAPGGAIVPRPGERRTLVERNYLGLVAQVPLPALRSAAAAHPEDAPVLARALKRGLGGGPGATRLARHLRHIVAEIDAPDSLLDAPRAARAAGGLVVALLLDSLVDTAPARRPAAAGLHHVRRAEALIRARVAEDLSVPALAAELGIGTRALQLAFQAHRGAAPRDAIAAARLEAVQARLRAAPPEASVTGIALDCGVTHLGRFAAVYRARFGEAPSETLARGRRRG